MKSNKAKFAVFIIILVVVIVGGGIFMNSRPQPVGKLDSFAQCLGTNGAKFYGAFWCPHCQDQKAMFGPSKKYLPYIECSTPDRQMLQICKDNNIQGFPTWVFQDESRLSGAVDLATLADKTQCVLPE